MSENSRSENSRSENSMSENENIVYKTPYNVLKDNFLTKNASKRNNSSLKISTNILTRGKRHPLVKNWIKKRTSKNERPYNFLTRKNNLWIGKRHSDFFNSRINLSKYKNIIGSGGYGMIVSSNTGSNVTKLYYKMDTCNEMGHEYIYFITAFNALEDNPYPQISIPEPKKIDNRKILFGQRAFQCGIEMKRVKPLEIMSHYNNGITHVILKEDYKPGLNREKPRISDSNISDTNPSRGFFATGTYIESEILPKIEPLQRGAINNIDDIAYRMGIGYATLFIHAEIYPYDVEYCLGNMEGLLNLVIIDFGMCEIIDYTSSLDLITKNLLNGNRKSIGALFDIYFPSRDDPTFESFIAGMEYVKSNLTDQKKISLINSVISGWE